MTEHSFALSTPSNTDIGVRGYHRSLRNKLRKFSLFESLDVIRGYLQFLQHNIPLPNHIKAHPEFLCSRGPNKLIYEWELELLAKELILNAPEKGTRSLADWHELAGLVDKLRRFEEDIVSHPGYRDLFAKNALLGLYRTLHRQIPWQQRPTEVTIVRYFKIFSQPPLDDILRTQIGLSASELYTLGFLFTGHFADTSLLTWPTNLEVPGLSSESVDRFVGHFATGIALLKQQLVDAITYDQDYEYSFNPLMAFPLVWIEFEGRKGLIAPIPTFLVRRFTEGVYYEIYDVACTRFG